MTYGSYKRRVRMIRFWYDHGYLSLWDALKLLIPPRNTP